MSKFREVLRIGNGGNSIARMERKKSYGGEEYVLFETNSIQPKPFHTKFENNSFTLSIEDANKLLRYLEIGKVAYIGLTDDGLDSLIIYFRF